MRHVIFTLTLLLVASCASAQTVPNPSKADFTVSLDHAVITSYEIGWFLGAATSPVSTADVGKPIPDTVAGCSSPTPCAQVTINVMPLAFETYTAKMRAKAGTMVSEWSDPSNPFTRIPGKPGKPVPK